MARVAAVLIIIAAVYLFLGYRVSEEQSFGSAERSPTNARLIATPSLSNAVAAAESRSSKLASVEAGQGQEAGSLHLRGQIRDGENKPVSGATITLFALRDPFPSLEFTDPVATTNSQEEGFYQLLVDFSVSGWIVIEKPGFARVEEPLSPEQAGLLTRDYVLVSAQAAVTGRVVDTDGRPIEGAIVFVSFPRIAVPGENASISSRTGLTDGRGEFELVDLPLGEVALIASARGFLDSEGRVVDLNRDEDTDHEFVLEKGKIVRLEVIDSDGRPIPFPSARGPRKIPSSGDEEGRLDLTLPVDSTSQWEIVARGYLSRTVTIDPALPPESIILEAGQGRSSSLESEQ